MREHRQDTTIESRETSSRSAEGHVGNSPHERALALWPRSLPLHHRCDPQLPAALRRAVDAGTVEHHRVPALSQRASETARQSTGANAQSSEQKHRSAAYSQKDDIARLADKLNRRNLLQRLRKSRAVGLVRVETVGLLVIQAVIQPLRRCGPNAPARKRQPRRERAHTRAQSGDDRTHVPPDFGSTSSIKMNPKHSNGWKSLWTPRP